MLYFSWLINTVLIMCASHQFPYKCFKQKLGFYIRKRGVFCRRRKYSAMKIGFEGGKLLLISNDLILDGALCVNSLISALNRT